MASMLLVGGFLPKSTLVRMPNARPFYQRKTLSISAKRGPGVSHGGGGQINQARKSMDAANIEEKLTLGGFKGEKENKKKSKENADNGATINSAEASG
ncbi:unnamed protein product [Dovyalis caffra]|uniref:Uncharacterized protein n=1 Tax=Dovyalis caffra TaxID=77055 RepID=A0AAV1SIT1_9ROSI|nr:unnamed protein product [Dovyalis caffra]